jgi:hypothetical protein
LSKDMADQRKCFRPRRLAFGGRSLRYALIFGASLVVSAAFSPVDAEPDGLKNGAASLAAGKYDAAVRQLSSTINSDGVSASDAARALYLRGLAYRKMGETARAVADLGAAIWLGLPEPDKIKALVNRGLAYQAAGLSKEGETELAAARKLGGGGAVDTLIAEGGGATEGAAAIAAFATEVRPEEGSASSARARAEPLPSFGTSVTGGESPVPPPPQAEPQPTRTANASPSGWNTSVADESQPSSSGGNRLTRWFGSLTESGSSASAPQSAPAAAPPPAAAQQQTTQVARQAPQPPPAAASSNWSTTTEAQEASAAASSSESGSRWSRLFNRTAETDPAAKPAAPQPAAGGFRLQLATSRSEEDARALWKKVSQTQNLAGIQPDIERVEIGSFGTFYALRIGPFPDKAESLKVCNALKRSGIDCSPAEQ